MPEKIDDILSRSPQLGQAGRQLAQGIMRRSRNQAGQAGQKNNPGSQAFNFSPEPTHVDSEAEQNEAAYKLKQELRNSTLNMLGNYGLLGGRRGERVAEVLKNEAENLGENLGKAEKRLENLKTTRGKVKEGVSIGLEARGAMAEKRFTGEIFIVVLLCSLFKDFSDFVDLGTLGTLVNIPVSIAIFISFWGLGNKIRRKVIRRFIWPMIVEYIPFLNIIPVYTILTLWMRMKSDSDQAAEDRQAKEEERDTKNQTQDEE